MSDKAATTPGILVYKSEQKGELKSFGGSRSDDVNMFLINQAINTVRTKNLDEAGKDKQFQAAVATMAGIAPTDELEGMMAAQLFAAHNAAMECYGRAMGGNISFEARSENLSQANKLSRTYATLLESLNRHRGKGQQKVTVEHVHVHEGGQAVVGNVTHQGGGDREKLKDQPHEPESRSITDATGNEVPSQIEAERQAMPIACDAERTLPTTRRAVAGRAERK